MALRMTGPLWDKVEARKVLILCGAWVGKVCLSASLPLTRTPSNNIRKIQKARGCTRGSSCYSNTPLLPTSTSHPCSLLFKHAIVCALTTWWLSLFQPSTTLFVNQFLPISLLNLHVSSLNSLREGCCCLLDGMYPLCCVTRNFLFFHVIYWSNEVFSLPHID